MSKTNMKGGTPFGWASLCGTCTWAHIVTGYRESEMIVICTGVSPNIPVPFKVRDCTNYLGRDRPSWDEMKDLAIDVLPTTSAKKVGFRSDEGVSPEEDRQLTAARK
jgi:hypothetical protein